MKIMAHSILCTKSNSIRMLIIALTKSPTQYKLEIFEYHYLGWHVGSGILAIIITFDNEKYSREEYEE